MVTVVSYDISEDKLRTRFAKTMKSFGFRVQKSVFECDLDPERYQRLAEAVRRFSLGHEDSIRLYVLCERCLTRTIVHGTQKPVLGESYFNV